MPSLNLSFPYLFIGLQLPFSHQFWHQIMQIDYEKWKNNYFKESFLLVLVRMTPSSTLSLCSREFAIYFNNHLHKFFNIPRASHCFNYKVIKIQSLPNHCCGKLSNSNFPNSRIVKISWQPHFFNWALIATHRKYSEISPGTSRVLQQRKADTKNIKCH